MTLACFSFNLLQMRQSTQLKQSELPPRLGQKARQVLDVEPYPMPDKVNDVGAS